MSRSKTILTTAVASGLAVTAATAEVPAVQDTDLLEFDIRISEDDLIVILGEEASSPWPASPDGLDDADNIGIDYAQTWGGGTGNDGILAPGGNRGGVSAPEITNPSRKVKKPGQGITLDNGIKKKGKLRTQGQAGQQGKKRKKK